MLDHAIELAARLVAALRGQIKSHPKGTWVISRDPEALVKTLFVDDAFGRGFQAFNAINKAFFALSITAFAISIMGLFGMAVFTASRR